MLSRLSLRASAYVTTSSFVQASMWLMPDSMHRVTTSRRFFMKSGLAMEAPSQLSPLAAAGTAFSMRFQCPPMHTADTHRLVLPRRRYSISGL